jgi:protein phosphatase
MVVYGHTPVASAEWHNNTVNIDTGCVFGGKLTALRYPEKELVQIDPATTYAEPARPLQPVEGEERSRTRPLRIDDVLGKRVVDTRLRGRITIREEQAAAALEAISRSSVHPAWLIYLPPTMSPCETSRHEGYLEHPREALAYYGRREVGEVICEEKHMGSRAVVTLCRDAEAARRRFGGSDRRLGVCTTRTGRRFFDDGGTEAELLGRVANALAATGFWAEVEADWICLDCEITPWNAKAADLLRSQYAPVRSAGVASLEAATQTLDQAQGRGVEVGALADQTRVRAEAIQAYGDAYAPYCWPVDRLDGIRVAPFHVLAAGSLVLIDRPHSWHMEWARRLAEADDLFVATRHLTVDPTDDAQVGKATDWWLELTASGAERMVVKPMDFVPRGKQRLSQPGIKCRGHDYLRIIYGPEYAFEGNLSRLRSRNLRRKRSLAMREFALGIEALERYVRNEPLWRVHECVFGILAFECEPVDPRL